MLGYYVHHLSPFIFQLPNGFGPRWYGLAYVLAFVLGTLLYRRLAERGYSEIEPGKVSDFITWSALFGVLLGGRLGYFLFYDWNGFASDPTVFFRVWEGGMASHGGIIGLFFYTLWYARRHKISWTGLGDNLVVVAPLGIFFGRMANFINGELYGRKTQVPWAMQFPAELQDAGAWSEQAWARAQGVLATFPGSAGWTVDRFVVEARSSVELRELLAGILAPRHPSQLYAAALEGLLLFAVLWWVRTRCKVRNGVLTGLFFIGYAVVRIAGEHFREPDAGLIGSLTRGQFYSVFMILIGAGFLIWSRKSAPSKNRHV